MNLTRTFAPDVLSGKNVFVAGASGGINLQIAKDLHSLGASVTVMSRDHERISAAAQSIDPAGQRATGTVADVRDYDAVDQAIRTAAGHGPIDVVVSGAAGNFLSPAKSMSSNAFRTVIDIDLIGTFNVFRAAYEHLRKPGASLVAISAPQATQPFKYQAHACAAKAGVNLLVQTLATEWGEDGIRVNAISPGFIGDTEGTRRLAGSAEQQQKINQSIALRRFGESTEIGAMVAFLATDAASYVSGAILDCNGGLALDPITAASV